MKLPILLVILGTLAICCPAAEPDTARTNLLQRHREYQAEGDLFNDYLLLTQAAEKYKNEKAYEYLADTHNKLGNLFDHLNETEPALKNFERAEKYFKETGDSISTTKIKLNIANCYFKQGEKEKALSILLSLESNPITRQDTGYHASVLFSLLRSLLNADDMDAYRHYIDVLAKLPITDSIIEYKRNTHIGFYHYLRKEYPASIELYREALAEAEKRDDPTVANCILGLIYNYTAIQQYDSATVYWNRYYTFKESTEHIAYASQIKRMESLNTIKNYEMQIQQEQEKRRLLQQIIVLALALIVLIVAGIIIILRNKKRQERMEQELKEAKNRELTTLLENERLQNESRKLELENQNRRLCLNLMILEEKANALKSIQQQIIDANESGKVPADIARTIDTQIKYHLQDVTNWYAFKEAFEKIHPTFFQKLKNKYPNLSEHELRFCAFACSGLDSKQIAFILNIQIESIRKIRQRLRKKLGLNPTESLEELLREFSS